ncbi:hypothetical protein AB838_01440 [Rhodobacteraceae bacterium (ex Bugula neritina AB1)]|nr:hypothetical protein AB838_01440 [Rhodobacteraceae bacterium (ex Bugula neritina AB1)]
MFIPVSGRIDPIKPNRGLLTARPVVRSDNPDKSESADNRPRGEEDSQQETLLLEDGDSIWDTAGTETPVPGHELFHENAVLAEHLVMQHAWPQGNNRAGGALTASHGYEEARTLTA